MGKIMDKDYAVAITAAILILSLMGLVAFSINQHQLDLSRLPDLEADVEHKIPGTAVSIIIDTSGSMDGEPIAKVIEVITEQVVPKMSFYDIDNGLEVSLITCGGLAPTTGIHMSAFNSDQLHDMVSMLGTGGGTPLAAAVVEGFVQIGKSDRTNRHLFILSDGEGNTSVRPVLDCMRNQGLDKVNVSLIGFQSHIDHYKDFQDFGAAVVMVDDPNTLDFVMSNVFDAILRVEAE